MNNDELYKDEDLNEEEQESKSLLKRAPIEWVVVGIFWIGYVAYNFIYNIHLVLIILVVFLLWLLYSKLNSKKN